MPYGLRPDGPQISGVGAWGLSARQAVRAEGRRWPQASGVPGGAVWPLSLTDANRLCDKELWRVPGRLGPAERSDV